MFNAEWFGFFYNNFRQTLPKNVSAVFNFLLQFRKKYVIIKATKFNRR